MHMLRLIDAYYVYFLSEGRNPMNKILVDFNVKKP